MEGLAAVVNGARCHYADPQVQAAVLVAMKKRMDGAGDSVRENSQIVDCNLGKLFELGALEAALAAMSAHVAERAVQAAACGMLARFVNSSPHATAIRDRFVELGGIASIMGALDAIPRDRELVKDAMGALGSLMIKDKARTTQIIALGGMERMLEAMDNHPDDSSGVCCAAVSALHTMSLAGQEAQQRLAALVVEARVRAAMAAPDVHKDTTYLGQKLLDVLPAVDLAQQESAARALAEETGDCRAHLQMLRTSSSWGPPSLQRAASRLRVGLKTRSRPEVCGIRSPQSSARFSCTARRTTATTTITSRMAPLESGRICLSR